MSEQIYIYIGFCDEKMLKTKISPQM